MILFYSDDMEHKVRLLFNMYDINSRGYLGKEEISQMVRYGNLDVTLLWPFITLYVYVCYQSWIS